MRIAFPERVDCCRGCCSTTGKSAALGAEGWWFEPRCSNLILQWSFFKGWYDVMCSLMLCRFTVAASTCGPSNTRSNQCKLVGCVRCGAFRVDTARPGSIKYMSDRLLRRCGHITTQEPPVINEALWLEVLHSSLALMRDLGGGM